MRWKLGYVAVWKIRKKTWNKRSTWALCKNPRTDNLPVFSFLNHVCCMFSWLWKQRRRSYLCRKEACHIRRGGEEKLYFLPLLFIYWNGNLQAVSKHFYKFQSLKGPQEWDLTSQSAHWADRVGAETGVIKPVVCRRLIIHLCLVMEIRPYLWDL